MTWSKSTSLNELPPEVQTSLKERSSFREYIVECQITLPADTCTPITHEELLNALKCGKSTAPGSDGITYDIVNCLARIKNGPLLDLINMSYDTGYLPQDWKKCYNCTGSQEQWRISSNIYDVLLL